MLDEVPPQAVRQVASALQVGHASMIEIVGAAADDCPLRVLVAVATRPEGARVVGISLVQFDCIDEPAIENQSMPVDRVEQRQSARPAGATATAC